MHGPDGTDYQERISGTEIVTLERIAMLHGESRGDPNAIESVLTFAPDGAETRIEMRAMFPTKELRDGRDHRLRSGALWLHGERSRWRRQDRVDARHHRGSRPRRRPRQPRAPQAGPARGAPQRGQQDPDALAAN